MMNDTRKHEHELTLYSELICHLPYAIFSVAFGLILLSFLSAFSIGNTDATLVKKGAKLLFHSFHFMHIIFAATGTLIMFFRFSKNYVKALFVGIFSPTIFCMLSDAILPYLGGRLLGVPMKFHLCFINDFSKIVPFLLVGIINGFIMSKHDHEKQGFYSISSHAVHILVSSLASIFYLVSHGFTDWYAHIGFVFLFLIVAVVVPCTLSDVVVPIFFARAGKKL